MLYNSPPTALTKSALQLYINSCFHTCAPAPRSSQDLSCLSASVDLGEDKAEAIVVLNVDEGGREEATEVTSGGGASPGPMPERGMALVEVAPAYGTVHSHWHHSVTARHWSVW